MITDLCWRLPVALLALCAAAAHAHRPHVHGEAELNVASEDGKLFVELVAPAESLLGFERAPRNDTEIATLRAVRAALEDGAALFVSDSPCTPSEVSWEDPFEGEIGQAVDDHADFVLRVSFVCEAAPRALEVRLFDVFPRIERIRAQYVTERAQGATTLQRGSAALAW